MKTLTTTWLAQIVAVAVLLTAGSASASSGLLSGNSPLGKNTLEGGYYRDFSSVSAETHRGCGEVSRWNAAGLFVAPNNVIVASGGGQWAGQAPLNSTVAGFQQQLLQQGRVVFVRGDLTLAEIGNLSSGLGREVIITRIGQTRYLNLVEELGGQLTLQNGERLILHTHPGQGFWGLQRSAFGTDFGGLPSSINRSAVVNESGWWRIYRSDGTLGPIWPGK